MDKNILIKAITFAESPESPTQQRLTYQVQSGLGVGELWYEVEKEYAPFVADDRCDTAVVAMLAMAIRNGYTHIRSIHPISSELYFNLTNHVIPQLCLAKGAKSSFLHLDMPITEQTFQAEGVACGMSLGIDSFATLAEYGKDAIEAPYKLTHVTYFNVGAHHGYDWRIGKGPYSNRELFEGHLQKVRSFASDNHYPLVVIDSNVSTFFREILGRSQFYMTHTYRNVSAAMLMQKLFSTYLYSAAFNLDAFAFSLDGDSATYEKWLLPFLSTGSFKVRSANKAWSRFEKTQRVADLESSHSYLTVCFLGIDNCGECDKCRKTLMTLDVLGQETLNQYSSTFDLEKYKSNFRSDLFKGIYKQMLRKGLYGSDMRDIFLHAVKTNFPYLEQPDLTETYPPNSHYEVHHQSVAFRSYPTLHSPMISAVKKGTVFEAFGKFGNWVFVRYQNQVGWVRTIGIKKYPVELYAEHRRAEVIQPTHLQPLPFNSGATPDPLEENQEVKVVGFTKYFYKCETAAGAHGFISKENVRVIPPQLAPPENQYSLVRVIEAVNILDFPSSDGTKVAKARKDQPFAILGSSAGWYRVKSATSTGFLQRADVRILEPREPSLRLKASVSQSTELKSLPTRFEETLLVLESEETVTVNHQVGQWYRITTAHDISGYVPTSRLKKRFATLRKIYSKVIS